MFWLQIDSALNSPKAGCHPVSRKLVLEETVGVCVVSLPHSVCH